MLQRFERFSGAIGRIYRDIQKIEADEMTRYGLRGAHAQYLVAMVNQSEGVTAAQLCRLCDKDKAAVSRAVAELEEKGMLTRGGEGGGYRAPIMLTAQGRQAAQYTCKKALAAVEQAGKGLDDVQREAFYAALELIAGNLSAIAARGLEE